MRRLFLFNPENDIALGRTDWNYTPSKAVRDFHCAGATLPLWYADRYGDMIYAQLADSKWVDEKRRIFGLAAELYDGTDEVEPVPWGFSMHALHQYRRMGASINPDHMREAMDTIRGLSHRRTAAALLDHLREQLPYRLPESPYEARSCEELEQYAARTPHFFMKAPWSSSGRGVVDCSYIPRKQILQQAEGIIRHQGSVMLEPALDKITDFAALFHADATGVRHIGYSLFFNTNGATSYGGNQVAPDNVLLGKLSEHADPDTISITASAVAQALTRMNVHHAYHGYFGVDMMIYRCEGEPQPLIAPSVEINLRMTMGIVAHKLNRYLLPEDKNGILAVRYAPDEPYTDSFVAENRRLCSGTLSLIPPHGGFRITLTVTNP